MHNDLPLQCCASFCASLSQTVTYLEELSSLMNPSSKSCAIFVLFKKLPSASQKKIMLEASYSGFEE